MLSAEDMKRWEKKGRLTRIGEKRQVVAKQRGSKDYKDRHIMEFVCQHLSMLGGMFTCWRDILHCSGQIVLCIGEVLMNGGVTRNCVTAHRSFVVLIIVVG